MSDFTDDDECGVHDLLFRPLPPRKPVLWRNVFGEPVDLDSIDRAYALNIYHMVVARRAREGWTDPDFRADPLIQKLREVILKDAERRPEDVHRAVDYNARTTAAGLPFRAPVSDT